ncbi:MAG: triphosphoribosyl-dephospho-CoA synthase [Candidatus Thermoplasmatota archaeon]
MRNRSSVGSLASLACILELAAFKPGNVSFFFEYQKQKLEHFLSGAIAISEPMNLLARRKNYSVGKGIYDGVVLMNELQKSGDTHFGTILLFAPIAKSCYYNKNIKESLSFVLDSLTFIDALYVFKAFHIAKPKGICDVKTLDIRKKETLEKIVADRIGLKEFMEAGKNVNTIAYEYSTNYSITFKLLKKFSEEYEKFGLREAIKKIYIYQLSRRADSHIIGNHGEKIAIKVKDLANEALKKKNVNELKSFLEKNRINPGVTADLVATVLFLSLLSGLKVNRV